MPDMSVRINVWDRDAEPSLLGIDLIELETFIAVAEAGSFSIAAQRLHVAQPSVTGRVQRLETALGTKLLQRTTRRVETTADGALLLTEANYALRGLRSVVGKFREGARLARQRVVVAATPTIAAVTLPQIIKDYSSRFPDVQVDLRDLQYSDALDAVSSGAADLAVLALEEGETRFRFEPLWTRDMVFVAPAGHELTGHARMTLEELAHYPLMVVEQYQPIVARIAEALKQRGLTLSQVRTVGNLNTLIGMLDAGMVATLLPRSTARRIDPAKHTVVELDGVDLRRSFGIVLSPSGQLGTAADSFCAFLRHAMII